jgi:UDP-3-O-[3-hydroxymyristoyl] glucosamine N-acyltransferase
MDAKRTYTVKEIAAHVGGTVVGDCERRISGVGSIAGAGPEDLVFVDNPRFLVELETSRAGAAILPAEKEPPPAMSGIRVGQPALAMALAIELLRPRQRSFPTVSPQAFIGEGVEIGAEVGIGPGAYVGDRARVGRGTEIHPGATIGRDSTIGEDCIIYSGAHIYHESVVGNRVIVHGGAVIGADGFGFVQTRVSGPQASPTEPVRHHKVPQIGRVVLEDDVEIGACTCIDRAALEVTVVGRGTKIDDLVMIGHNCRVGRHVILVAQAGIAGSVEIGDYATIAGQAGIAGHIRIGQRAIVGARAGVSKTVEDGRIVLGAPAIDARQARKAYSLIEDLPEWKKLLSELKQRLEALERPGSGGAQQ